MDSDEFPRAFHRFWPAVVRCAARFLKDRAGAHDVAQEVFVALWRHWPELQNEAHAHRWLLRAARLRAWSVNRDDARNAEAIGSFARGLLGGNPAPRGLPAAIATALAGLPRLQQKALMHFAAGDSPQEGADALGCPLETVRSQIRRGLARLRRSVAPVPPPPPAPPPAHPPPGRPEKKKPLLTP